MSTSDATSGGVTARTRTRRRALLLVVCTIVVAIGLEQGPALAVEGSWEATGSLNVPRIAHKYTLLNTGKVLVTGGRTATAALTSAELYDPITELFTLTGSMTTSRWSHTATRLPNGKVLVAGGFTGLAVNAAGAATNAQAVTDTAELYDPGTGTWTATPPMLTRRALHTATLLDNGLVLVAGGRTCTDPPPATCDFTARTNNAELYNPATNTWTATAPMNAPRHTTSAVKLLTGKVLIPAGFGAPDPHDTDRTADLYDPATGTWSLTGNLNTSRARQGAMLLPDGTVLVGPGSRSTTCGPPVCNNGGPPFSAVIVETSEIYNPITDTWTLTTGKPILPGRFNFHQVVLPSGRALMAGGFGGPAGAESAQQSAEVFHMASQTWESAGSMTTVHGTSSSLANTQDAVILSINCGSNCGKVLVVGDNLTSGVADLYTGLTCMGVAATKAGTPGKDNILGTNRADVIVGLGGNDTIEALAGNDLICAGDGDDNVSAGTGNDIVSGGHGNDMLTGAAGDDDLEGDAGNDTLEGRAGDDRITGGADSDVCRGGDGVDTFATCEVERG